MSLLAEHPKSVFLGQAVACDGTAMRKTLAHLPADKLVEMPVAENMQLGMCTGIALAGGLPVSIYPRVNFLLEAISQLVQHLDKLPIYSWGGYKPRVIIRTAIATPVPLDPGAQHLGDYTYALRAMLKTIPVIKLDDAEQIVPAYKRAMERDGSTLLIERTELYA
jgi:pyruvate/2-oxoglutarate/acetoin dehydrogenase E1 component